jgi:hypothetical protein
MAMKVSRIKKATVTTPTARPIVNKATPRSAKHPERADDIAVMLNSYNPDTRAVVEAMCQTIGSISGVVTGVKWNSVSFRVENEWFATINVHAKRGIMLILHAGAKGKPDTKSQLDHIPGAKGLTWLGVERAAINVESAVAWKSQWKSLHEVIAEWVRCIEA